MFSYFDVLFKKIYSILHYIIYHYPLTKTVSVIKASLPLSITFFFLLKTYKNLELSLTNYFILFIKVFMTCLQNLVKIILKKFEKKFLVYISPFFKKHPNADGFCYMWYVSIGKRGCSKISSCLMRFINHNILQGVKQFSYTTIIAQGKIDSFLPCTTS